MRERAQRFPWDGKVSSVPYHVLVPCFLDPTVLLSILFTVTRIEGDPSARHLSLSHPVRPGVSRPPSEEEARPWIIWFFKPDHDKVDVQRTDSAVHAFGWLDAFDRTVPYASAPRWSPPPFSSPCSRRQRRLSR